MTAVREWTLAVCMACIAAGILQAFSAKNERTSVIKLVLTLYILVTAFAPLGALRYPDTRALPPAPYRAAAAEAPDTDALVLQRAQESLAATLRQSCAARGAALTQIQVTLAQGQDGVQIKQVVFATRDAGQTETANEAIREVLGQDVPLVAQQEDENGAGA